MELEDLKAGWTAYTAREISKQTLSEDEIKKMLRKRTSDITMKIRRNIGLGLVIVLITIGVFFVLGQVIKPVLPENIEAPKWVSILDIATYVVFIGAIIVFWIQFNKKVPRNVTQNNLATTIESSINAISMYRRMFVMVMVFIVLVIGSSFGAGYFEGFSSAYGMGANEASLKDMPLGMWLIALVGLLTTMAIFISIYLGLLQLFYNKLYGRYHKKLRKTLNELKDVG